jgi:hypothetical protein
LEGAPDSAQIEKIGDKDFGAEARRNCARVIDSFGRIPSRSTGLGALAHSLMH